MFMSSRPIALTPLAPPTAEDVVPADVRAVVELFSAQLGNVTFPDIDAQSLQRATEELRADAANVAAARAALDAAVAQSAARLAALTSDVTRALAYARIYSEAHPERTALFAALAALAPPPASPASAAPPKRRGRPPRRSAELFDAARAPSDGASEA